MLTKEILLKCLYLDIETAGLYSTFSELSEKNSKLASLWENRCKWLRLNSGEELKNASAELLWAEKA